MHTRDALDVQEPQASHPHAAPPKRAVSQLSRRVKGEGSVPAASASPPPAIILPENCQPRVVDADIQRSLWALFPETTKRMEMRSHLKNMLLRILAHHRDRHYYQGLHELMGYVLYVMAPHRPYEDILPVCERLLCTRWRSFSEPKLANSEALLYAMHAVLAEEDAELAMKLEKCGVGPETHYAVSWVITWYVHCIDNLVVLGRLFDFFIADETDTAVVFFTAAFVLSEREQLLQWIADAEAEAGEIGDDVMVMARVYSKITTLPKTKLEHQTVESVNRLIERSITLRRKYTELVQLEKHNFLDGNVRKLGLLANRRTRNAALRLLWRFLPREWRSPASENKRRLALLTTGIALAAATIAITMGSGDKGGHHRLS
ncbi:GTPase activating protein of Rab-like GTPase [Strigomonas culicis]|uniref:GTPase activating protein of Rab-like GTPase n=1 Tax=Strigomonas culicis TaxID=28005 RepID=S9TF87_9TRYP|nr:GTPase activating protein of Rab-like GTPase [Strigomonas culicis]|eukprot:EPY16722.1 GTPase activating protein of Rab-like GTPase [Strigomonas culicis]